MNGEDTKDQIAGIWFEKEYTRTYPYNSLASAMIGFANATTGVIGLENQYNDTLNGTNGRSYGYLTAIWSRRSLNRKTAILWWRQ